jgi:hypothetical protein
LPARRSNREIIYIVGDLVRIRDGTHQEGMPDHRTGIVSQRIGPNLYEIKFGSNNFRFHAMFLELINRDEPVEPCDNP